MKFDFSPDAWIPYLTEPLVLAGFFILLATGFCRLLVDKGIIPPLQRKDGASVLKRILLYGFVIALVLIIGGFILKYFSSEKHAQDKRIKHIDQELVTRFTNLEMATLALDDAFDKMYLNSSNRLEKFDESVVKCLRDLSSSKAFAGLPLSGGLVSTDIELAAAANTGLSQLYRDLDVVTLSAFRWRLIRPDAPIDESARKLLSLMTVFKVLIDMAPTLERDWIVAAAVHTANKERFLKTEGDKYRSHLRNVFALIVSHNMTAPVLSGHLKRTDWQKEVTNDAAYFLALLEKPAATSPAIVPEKRERHYDPRKVNMNALKGRAGEAAP